MLSARRKTMTLVEKLRSYDPTSGYSKTMRAAAQEIDLLRAALVEAVKLVHDVEMEYLLKQKQGPFCYNQSCWNNDSERCKTDPTFDCNGRCMCQRYSDGLMFYPCEGKSGK